MSILLSRTGKQPKLSREAWEVLGGLAASAQAAGYVVDVELLAWVVAEYPQRLCKALDGRAGVGGGVLQA